MFFEPASSNIQYRCVNYFNFYSNNEHYTYYIKSCLSKANCQRTAVEEPACQVYAAQAQR